MLVVEGGREDDAWEKSCKYVVWPHSRVWISYFYVTLAIVVYFSAVLALPCCGLFSSCSCRGSSAVALRLLTVVAPLLMKPGPRAHGLHKREGPQ